MLYTPERKLIFIHISRTGGTTISRMLKTQIADIEQLSGQHSTIIEAQSKLGIDFSNSFKFAFVRNPWDRFVSWYALIGKTIQGAIQGEQLQDPSSDHWRQFDQFLESWSNREIEVENGFRKELSQWGQLTDQNGQVCVEEIGRFESFTEDVKRIFTKNDLEFEPQPIINESYHHHYSLYYSDFGRELVESVFRDDVMKFNYSFTMD